MDTLSDIITRIRNAYRAGKESIIVPHSRLSKSVSTLLATHGYLSAVEVRSGKTNHASPKKELVMTLAYKDHLPVLTEVKRISKPGRRITVSASKLPRVLDGYGIAIVSTSQGLMTDGDARKKHIGGEILLTVY